MSTPSHPRPAGEQDDPAQPSTREIPVVAPAAAPLPPHPGATAHAPVAAQPTGPVDFVPGLPAQPARAGEEGTEPPPAADAPAGATAVSAAPTWPDTLHPDAVEGDDRKARSAALGSARLTGIGLGGLGLVLLELGLLPAYGTRSLWSAIPLWSAFATLAALAVLLAFVAGRGSADGASGTLRRVPAAGAGGVAVFWLLVVLPHAASNRGFVLTAAAAALGAGFWMGARETS